MILSQTAIIFWIFQTEIITYEILSAFSSETSGGIEAVLSTNAEECQGLWLPEEKTSHESCICEELPGAHFTQNDKLPFLRIKSITAAPVRGNGGNDMNKFDTGIWFWCHICDLWIFWYPEYAMGEDSMNSTSLYKTN